MLDEVYIHSEKSISVSLEGDAIYIIRETSKGDAVISRSKNVTIAGSTRTACAGPQNPAGFSSAAASVRTHETSAANSTI